MSQTANKPKKKPGLVPSTGLYGAIALILILALGLLMTDSLSKISRLATSTRDHVLPAVLNRQRTAVNLERLGRFAEIVYRSEDARIRRQYKLAARILANDSIFENNEKLNAKVMLAYREIELISDLRDEHDALKAQYDRLLFEFVPGTAYNAELHQTSLGAEVITLIARADRAKDLAELNKLQETLNAIVERHGGMSASTAGAVDAAKRLFNLHHEVLIIDKSAEGFWKQVNGSLDMVTANLSAEAAISADDSFTFIAEKADEAMYTSLIAATALMATLLALLCFVQRNIVSPIIRSIEGLNKVSKGKRELSLPEERILELDNIRQAVERSAELMAELADKTDAMKQTNTALEKEIQSRQQTQILLADAKERAESADRAKSDFLAGMSHEIRTPMNTMIGMGELLLETNPTPKQREYIETLQSSGSMLLGIINDVLDLSKIEAGEVKLDIVDIDRDQFMERTRRIVAGRAEQKRIEFVIDMDEDVPHFFRGDPTRLRQVLVNLIDNGVKFTEHGEVRLAVRRAPLEGPNALTFAVIDTGIGIPDETQAHIFQRFTQADTSTTREYGGTGLGLPISQRLIELMGGEIKLESTPGQGAAFHFTIELENRENAKRESTSKNQSTNAQTDILSSIPVSILVAEDSESNRALIDLYFKKTACKLDFATDGLEAIKLFSEKDYDLILMDIQMPGMDGYEATRQIRAMEEGSGTPPIPIVAVTANAFKEDRERSAAAGCTDYLAKPVSKASLLERVAYHALNDGGGRND